MKKSIICPECGFTQIAYDYGLMKPVCVFCRRPVNNWKIYEILDEESILPEETEIPSEEEPIGVIIQVDESPMKDIYHEIEPSMDVAYEEIRARALRPTDEEIQHEKIQEFEYDIPEELLPADYDGLMPIGNLAWDPYNPRDEEPIEELVESVRKTGFARAIIIRPGNNEKYLVTDGWQRAQAAVMAGWPCVPYKLYASAPEALEETKREDIKREWTRFQRIKYYRNFYDACREIGMNHESTIKRIINKDPASESSIIRYLRITNPLLTPLLVQALLKQPSNRTTNEWDQLEKIYYPIRRKRRILSLGQADAIATYLRNFSTEKKVRAAIGILGMSNAEASRLLSIVSKYPDSDPLEIIEELSSGYGIDEILDIGILTVDPKMKYYIRRYCAKRRITVKNFIRELLNNWFSEIDET